MINKNIMKKIAKINKYQEGGIISKKPQKIDLNNVTADPRQGGKSVTGNPLTTTGPHLYELPKNFAPINPTGKKQIAADENETNVKKSKPKLTNSRAEATAQNMQNLIGSSIDLAQKIGEIGKTKQEKKNLEATHIS